MAVGVGKRVGLQLLTRPEFSKAGVSDGIWEVGGLCAAVDLLSLGAHFFYILLLGEKERGMCGDSWHLSAFNGTSYMFPQLGVMGQTRYDITEMDGGKLRRSKSLVGEYFTFP
jgi:hypothetical protein